MSSSSGAGTSERRDGRPEGESRQADEQVSVIGEGDEAVSGRSVQRKEGASSAAAKAPDCRALDVRCDRGGLVSAEPPPRHLKATFSLANVACEISVNAVRSRTV